MHSHWSSVEKELQQKLNIVNPSNTDEKSDFGNICYQKVGIKEEQVYKKL